MTHQLIGSIAAPIALAVIAACTTQSATPSGSPPAAQSVAAGPSLEERVLRGRHVVATGACGDCHGAIYPGGDGWLAGAKTATDTFMVGPFKTYPANLTPDPVTGTGRYSERQIFNALRYGLRPDATPDVEITSTTPGQGNYPAQPRYLAPSMPWAVWRHMPDEDLRAAAAYLKHGLKPVNNKVPASEAPPDHWAEAAAGGGPYPAAAHPTENETALSTPQLMRGRALVINRACSGCHGGGPNPAAKGYLAGTKSPSDEFQIGPFRTRPRNLTPDNATGLGRFSERQIFNALRFGLRPGETPDVEITSTIPGQGNFPLRPKYLAPPMPWISWRHLPDEDLWAIAAYLKRGVKPVENRVADSEGPPDFWASNYTVEKIGPYPIPPFPTANEKGLR
jgi:mono/diheme cytochrome c family protein